MFIQISIFYIYILRMVNVYNLQGLRVQPNVPDHKDIPLALKDDGTGAYGYGKTLKAILDTGKEVTFKTPMENMGWKIGEILTIQVKNSDIFEDEGEKIIYFFAELNDNNDVREIDTLPNEFISLLEPFNHNIEEFNLKEMIIKFNETMENEQGKKIADLKSKIAKLEKEAKAKAEAEAREAERKAREEERKAMEAETKSISNTGSMGQQSIAPQTKKPKKSRFNIFSRKPKQKQQIAHRTRYRTRGYTPDFTGMMFRQMQINSSLSLLGGSMPGIGLGSLIGF